MIAFVAGSGSVCSTTDLVSIARSSNGSISGCHSGDEVHYRCLGVVISELADLRAIFQEA